MQADRANLVAQFDVYPHLVAMFREAVACFGVVLSAATAHQSPQEMELALLTKKRDRPCGQTFLIPILLRYTVMDELSLSARSGR